jgi:hypothetical protein
MIIKIVMKWFPFSFILENEIQSSPTRKINLLGTHNIL